MVDVGAETSREDPFGVGALRHSHTSASPTETGARAGYRSIGRRQGRSRARRPARGTRWSGRPCVGGRPNAVDVPIGGAEVSGILVRPETVPTALAERR